jgi:hypothetical protein
MHLRHLSRLAAISSLLLIAVSLAIAVPNPGRERKYSGKELDELMAEVWQNCEINLDNLRNYVFNEKEVWENNLILGHAYRDTTIPQNLKSFHREYVWIVRDGYLVRSPVSINGIDISREEKKKGEEEWIENQRNQKVWKSSMDLFVDFLRDCIKKYGGWYYSSKKGKVYVSVIRCPSSCSEWENDFRPPLSSGKYRYRGEKLFEGRSLLSIEFVPDPIRTIRRGNIPGVVDATKNIWNPGPQGVPSISVPYSYYVDKPHLKILIDPEEHQLVQVLSSVDDCGYKREYSMVMDKTNGKVWLPKIFSVNSESKLPGYLRGKVHYLREFYSYSIGEVQARFWSEDVKTRIWYDMDNLQPKQ